MRRVIIVREFEVSICSLMTDELISIGSLSILKNPSIMLRIASSVRFGIKKQLKS